MTPRSGEVTVTAGNQTRRFNVAQVAATSMLRNGVGTSYIQLQGRNLYLQGSNVRTRDLPNQQWNINHHTTINGNRYYRLSQGSQILAVTTESSQVDVVRLVNPANLTEPNRGLWRFEQVGNYHYRIVSRWTYQNGRTTALTGSETSGAATTITNMGAANQLWYIRRVANFLHHRTDRPYPWRVAGRSFSIYLCSETLQGRGWEQTIRNSITGWNTTTGNLNAGTSITYRRTGASTPHMFEVRNRSASSPTAFGSVTYVRMTNGNIIEHSSARIFAERINEYALTMRNVPALAIARSVVAHEIGHLLGLADDPPNYVNSIMHTHRTRSVNIAHNAFDARNVRLIFGVA